MKRHAVTFTLVATACALVASLFLFSPAFAQQAAGRAGVSQGVVQWGLLAAALATGLSSLAAGIAVGSVGSAAIGAITEKPELFGRVLIFVGLAEGIAIYGLIISILILERLG